MVCGPFGKNNHKRLIHTLGCFIVGLLSFMTDCDGFMKESCAEKRFCKFLERLTHGNILNSITDTAKALVEAANVLPAGSQKGSLVTPAEAYPQ
jgi:hypothetical protein